MSFILFNYTDTNEDEIDENDPITIFTRAISRHRLSGFPVPRRPSSKFY